MTVRAAQWVDRAVSVFSVVALAASNQNWPASLWEVANGVAPWTTVLLAVLASIFSLSPLTACSDRRRSPLREIERRKLLTSYGSMLEKAATVGLAISDPALHVWKVERLKLKRVVTYRLSEGNQLRRFSPKKGVGVVGLAWRDAEEKHFDVEALARRFDTREKFEIFAARHGDEVMNLDWAAFTRFKHRGAVFASPVMRRERVVGVVTFDSSARYSELLAAGIPEELNKLAATLSDSMENIG